MGVATFKFFLTVNMPKEVQNIIYCCIYTYGRDILYVKLCLSFLTVVVVDF